MHKKKGDDIIEQLHHLFQALAANEKQPDNGEINKAGDVCPACGVGKIDYDGTLNLICAHCGWRASGGGACT
jgi:hypothetical protein